MGSCAAPSAKGDDKFITTDYLQQCRYCWSARSCIFSTATEGMEIINIKEVKTIKKINPADGAASRPRYQSRYRS